MILTRLEMCDANPNSFIGLTPGVLVSVGVYRWIRGVFSNRKGVRQWAEQGQLLLILR